MVSFSNHGARVRFCLAIALASTIVNASGFSVKNNTKGAINRPPVRPTQSSHVVYKVQEPSNDFVKSKTIISNVITDQDSIERFSSDLTVVLKQLRKEKLDPALPRIHRVTPLPSISVMWTAQDWERHVSRLRYWDWIRTIPKSNLVYRVLPQLSVVIGWSCLAVWLCGKEWSIIQKMALPLTPLSLVSTFVAALLTLRSNQGLARLNEGRHSLGKVVLYTRDMAQLISAFIFPKEPTLGLKLGRHVALFSWLLRNFLSYSPNGDVEDIVRTMTSKADADYILNQRKLPVAVVTRLRQVIHHLGEQGKLGTAEELALDHTTQELNHCIMATERIVNSPIPPLYTSHTGRLLMFYLFFLPLALRSALNGYATVLATGAVAFAMLGLDEISHLMEQPFRLLPLYQLSKLSMRDVGDAFCCQPPSLDDDHGSGIVYRQLPYWSNNPGKSR